MADPLQITFGLLASTGNPNAVDVLITALDSPELRFQKPAVTALLRRGQGRGVVEMIRRLQQLLPESRAELAAHPANLSRGLRQCLIHGDIETRANALELLAECGDFEQVGTLVELLQKRGLEQQDEVAQTLCRLTDKLYDQCHPQRDAASGTSRALRSPPSALLKVQTVLDQAVAAFEKLAMPEPIVHAILVLGDPENFAVKRALSQTNPACRDLAVQMLMTDCHPGVMQLILDCLEKNYPHARALEALSRRADIEFICHLLRWLPDRPTAFQQKNLRQVTSLAWLEGDLSVLEQIPPGLQPALITLLGAVGLPSSCKVEVQEWLVRNGTTEGRNAASGVLSHLDDSSVQRIIFEGLESDHEDVQAWATTQLRHRGIPHALAMLVERLDSPLAAVRLAAQGELSDFNIQRLMDLFDHLDPDICRRAGNLVRKIDPLAVRKLEQVLSHPVRRKRMRAARASQALGMNADVAPALLYMLEDADPLVRRTAIEVLANVGLPEVYEALQERQADESPRVRESARKALQEWTFLYGSQIPVGASASAVSVNL